MWMKRMVAGVTFVSTMTLMSGAWAGNTIRPFVLAQTQSSGTVQSTVTNVTSKLKQAGFKVVGTDHVDLSQYQPYKAATIIDVTSPDLLSAAARTSHGAYGSVLSVSVVKTNAGQIQVSYQNPVYVSYAYRMKTSLQPVLTKLATALGNEKTFGAHGMTPNGVENYHYTFGMEYFNEPLHLNTYSSHSAAVTAIRKSLMAGKEGTHLVYEETVPGTDQTVFGVALDSKTNKMVNNAYVMSVVDFNKLKGAAYMPYQILVIGNKAEALNLRFRLAVFFPNLSMMGQHSFMTLMSAPKAVKKALIKVAGGHSSSGFSLF